MHASSSVSVSRDLWSSSASSRLLLSSIRLKRCSLAALSLGQMYPADFDLTICNGKWFVTDDSFCTTTKIKICAHKTLDKNIIQVEKSNKVTRLDDID